MSLLDRQKEVTGYLMDGVPELGLRGWPLSGACAVTGNFSQENLCKAVTTGPLDHNSQGLAQWRLGRLTELMSWSKKNFGGRDDAWMSLRAQCAFTLYETARDYPGLDAELRKGLAGVKPEDVRRVLDFKTAEFCWVFERPKRGPTAGLANRQKHAASVFQLMDTAPAPAPAPEPTVTPTTGVVLGGAAAAAGTAGTVAVQTGDIMNVWAIVAAGVFGIFAATALFLMRKPKEAPPQIAIEPALSLFDRLKIAAENLALAKAEYAEAAEAVRDQRRDEDDLLSSVDDAPPPIEHNGVSVNLPLGNPVDAT